MGLVEEMGLVAWVEPYVRCGQNRFQACGAFLSPVHHIHPIHYVHLVHHIHTIHSIPPPYLRILFQAPVGKVPDRPRTLPDGVGMGDSPGDEFLGPGYCYSDPRSFCQVSCDSGRK